MKENEPHFPIVLILLIGLLGCEARDARFQSDYRAALDSQTGQDLYARLLQLDQKYPNRLEIKTDLGVFLLSAGELDTARIYLESAAALASRTGSPKQKALLFANLAELSFRSKEYPRAVECADEALRLNPNEPLGVVFTRGKAHYLQGSNAEALADFSTGWSTARSTMVPDDFRAYSLLLIGSGEPEKALEVLGEYQARFSYETGTGITESVLLEKLGRVEESVLCAFKELEYQRYSGALTDQNVVASLDGLSAKLADGAGKDMAETLRRFVSGEWEAVGNSEALERMRDQPFARYIALASRMEAGALSPTTMSDYIALEPYCRGLAGYYYHLWRGMKVVTLGYSKDTALPILEKCILLAPQTRCARESRREIGTLLGLSAADGEKLLLGAELDAIAQRVLAGADLSSLEAVFALLSVPDNAYELAGVILLKKLISLESVRSLVSDRENAASGKLKERLSFVLRG